MSFIDLTSGQIKTYNKTMDKEYIKAISKRIINKSSTSDKLAAVWSGYYSYHQQLKLIRKALGYTQKRLAEKAGVSLRTLTRIERGEVEAPLPTISKIAKALHADTLILILPEKNIVDLVDEKIEKEAQRIVNMSASNTAMEGHAPDSESIEDIFQKVKALLYKKRNITWDD